MLLWAKADLCHDEVAHTAAVNEDFLTRAAAAAERQRQAAASRSTWAQERAANEAAKVAERDDAVTTTLSMLRAAGGSPALLDCWCEGARVWVHGGRAPHQAFVYWVLPVAETAKAPVWPLEGFRTAGLPRWGIEDRTGALVGLHEVKRFQRPPSIPTECSSRLLEDVLREATPGLLCVCGRYSPAVPMESDGDYNEWELDVPEALAEWVARRGLVQ
jgi:hypothetical protein